MTVNQAQQISNWKDILGLCRVGPDEMVVVVTGESSRPANVEAARTAVMEIGAPMFQLQAFPDARPMIENRPAMEAMTNADMIIDLMGLYHLRGGEQQAILDSGTRILAVLDGPDVLARLMPTEDDKRRAGAAAACIEGAKEMRVTSDAGTDLTVKFGEYPVVQEYGYSDEPGHWDVWPAGFVCTWPNEQSANGTIVFDRGDMILPFKNYMNSPVTLTIRDGYIRDIEGAFDADYLSEFMGQFNDPEAYAVSHLGWGLQTKAQWTALAMIRDQTNGNDGRSYQGGFMFSTGPNTDGGGTRDTECHLDMPMRNCSVILDGETIVDKGEILPEDQRAN